MALYVGSEKKAKVVLSNDRYGEGYTNGYNQCTADMQDDLQAKYNEGYAQCNTDMQDDLQAKYNEGYSAGETAGYSEGVAAQPTPTISVSTGGLITANAGEKSATKQLTTQATKTITPSTSNQTAIAAGTYATGAVTVAGSSSLQPYNIVKGVTIFGVSGNVLTAEAYEPLIVQGCIDRSISHSDGKRYYRASDFTNKSDDMFGMYLSDYLDFYVQESDTTLTWTAENFTDFYVNVYVYLEIDFNGLIQQEKLKFTIAPQSDDSGMIEFDYDENHVTDYSIEGVNFYI